MAVTGVPPDMVRGGVPMADSCSRRLNRKRDLPGGQVDLSEKDDSPEILRDFRAVAAKFRNDGTTFSGEGSPEVSPTFQPSS